MATDDDGSTLAQPTKAVFERLWLELGGNSSPLRAPMFLGEGSLSSIYPVTDFAAAAVAAAGLAVAELLAAVDGTPRTVMVDRRLASFWFFGSLRPLDWTSPAAWNAVAGDYRTADGWIKLHTNAPRHRTAALNVLGVREDRSEVEAAVRRWRADQLERDIVSAGGCAAEMRSTKAWRLHPQGMAVAREPLVRTIGRVGAPFASWRPSPDRPLSGLRVLDLTRVLAGPVATRFLAGYGADVLRIDPPEWDEPAIVPEVTLGKRCARLDLTVVKDRTTFTSLLEFADILVHGYRPGALEQLGFGEEARRSISPDLTEISLDAYGWEGPWSARRGFDSLVQMSAGIAEAGMRWKASDTPAPLPVQALDHATGYLMAAAAVRAVTHRLQGKGVVASRLSLARTADLLVACGPQVERGALAPASAADFNPEREIGPWGEGLRLTPPVQVEQASMGWSLPASALGSAPAQWAL